MIPGDGYSLTPSNDDYNTIRAKGLLRITALADWMNSETRPHPETIERRLKSYAKDYMLSQEEVGEILSDASMALKKGKKAYDYVKEGKPSFSRNAGTYMKYLKNITPEEFESVKRETALSREGQGFVLDSPGSNSDYTPEQRSKVIASGKRPHYTAGEAAAGTFGKVF